MTRQNQLETARAHPDIPVLIIGGGVNGLGLLRELAMQGIGALLVEKSDFCSGTSAASTRVIHGGLRYLENGEFRLVREALAERNRLLKNAPHYVRPLPTTIPIFSWTRGTLFAIRKFLGFGGKPGDRGALLIKIGLTLYDWFSGREKPMPSHHFDRRQQALALRPLLNPAVVAAATYYDARVVYPERLCLELALDAEALPSGALALNYVRVVGAHRGTVRLRDEIDGIEFEVRPRVVVNATGAWIDLTNRAMQRESQFIGGTKGSHLVLDHPQLFEATRGEMLYFANLEGRICIFYPFEGRVIAGSTDIPAADPDAAVCDEDETTYILDSIRQVFPSLQVDHSHIVFRFCGVRPLPSSKAATTGQISRDHHAELIPPGGGVEFPIYSLIGGKWTTFRAFAEQVADEILPLLGKTRLRSTADEPIGGGRDFPRHEPQRQRWIDVRSKQYPEFPPERLRALLERYGTRADEVLSFLSAEPDVILAHHDGYSRREIEFLCRHERVVHLDDLVLRRTLIGLLGETTYPLLEELAEVAAPVLSWTAEEAEREVEHMLTILEQRHGVKLERVSPSPDRR